MKDRIVSIIKCMIMFLAVMVLFISARNMKNIDTTTKNANLIIYGDTIANGYNPLVEGDKVYLSFDTVEKFIDETLFYDSSNEKIILTTENGLYKFGCQNNIASKNLKEYDAKASWKKINDTPYIDMNLIKEIYNIKCEYDKETNTISVDKLNTSDIPLNYNEVRLYNSLSTKSEVLDVLNTNNTVTVYTDSLKHNRWYKVKSDDGKIGYIEKAAVTVKDDSSDDKDKDEQANSEDTEKLIMFWQYGSSLKTLGDKIEGVNVVMPTWYAISDDQGSVEINYNEDYYNKAKANGYQIWPIITNGIDNKDLDRKQVTSEIMNDEQKRENLIRNIVDIIKNNKLDGINIDFEGMLEEDKYMYTQFLRELYPMVKETGAKLSVDIYFTSYIDRQGVGKACDYVMLMGYDQRGNWSKEAGSISEINWVDKNIASLIQDSNIPSSKIILGVPFYTRLWIESASGDLSTKVYTMNDTQNFLSKYNLTPTMDNVSGQNYIAMKDGDDLWRLWIEDADSISKRADIVTKYNLAGITAWQKGYETDDIWSLLNEKLKK